MHVPYCNPLVCRIYTQKTTSEFGVHSGVGDECDTMHWMVGILH